MSQNPKTGLLSDQMQTAAAGVLGAMLIDENAVGPMLQAVTEEDFQAPEFRNIFRAFRELYGQGRHCDAILVNEHLGGAYSKLLAELLEATPTAANAEAYAQALRESSRLWRLRGIGEELSQAEGLDACRNLLDKANRLFSERGGVRRLTLDQGFRQFFKRHSQTRPPDYLHWGLGGLDGEIHAGPGDMVVIGGYPSAGKTALALQFAFHIARTKRVGFYSYETSADKLHDRTVACQTLTSFSRMMSGKLECDDYGRVKDMREHLTSPQMDYLEVAGMTVSDIGADAMAHHYEVIVVDYLQKIPAARTSGRTINEFERVSQVSNDLQQLGRRTGKTVIALSQLSRPRDGNEAPTMASLRQSGQIEQDADVVLLLWKEYPNDPSKPTRYLRAAKNKDGEAGLNLLLNFDGDKQRFSKSIAQPLLKREREVPEQQNIFHPIKDSGPSPFEEQKGAKA